MTRGRRGYCRNCGVPVRMDARWCVDCFRAWAYGALEMLVGACLTVAMGRLGRIAYDLWRASR